MHQKTAAPAVIYHLKTIGIPVPFYQQGLYFIARYRELDDNCDGWNDEIFAILIPSYQIFGKWQ
jgi:hypothetical protein